MVLKCLLESVIWLKIGGMLQDNIELEIRCIAAENECIVEELKFTVEIFWCIHIIIKKFLNSAKIYCNNSNAK